MNTTASGRLDATITLLSGSLARAKALADAESRIGARSALGLILATETALAELSALRMDALRDELAETLPRLCGGSPADDFEEIDPEFEACPESWPDTWHPALDGYVYETGPTPVDVLERDLESLRDERDWASYFDLRSQEIREEDLAAAGLAVG